MNFYKRYIGDYQRDTGHLSICEHGAYTLMLDVHYATGKPLPEDTDRIYRTVRATTEEERLAVTAVLDQFWISTGEGWINPRAMEEIGKAKAQADTNRRTAEAREAKRRHHEPLNDSLNDSSSVRSTNHQPIHSHSHSQIPEPKPTTIPEEFEDVDMPPDFTQEILDQWKHRGFSQPLNILEAEKWADLALRQLPAEKCRTGIQEFLSRIMMGKYKNPKAYAGTVLRSGGLVAYLDKPLPKTLKQRVAEMEAISEKMRKEGKLER